ncbi:SDR family oxidoreductase [Paractinoplanes brasiliensis]|uniref:NAD(P)-dependent dehydrogenase (Short-subunit alcohol dehydrogenase family) n=1 Tax=Paractinoplanes brasiliensis TaxID=52695 RepID=A0A4R6JLS1_9ACTN|nr:SDR family oxidoreductase [Actinoplanes brasiliensis]TDO37313.1 NAD(P)-dependent dehydrogenase (short-subunit alcohol dehydrogenase family) [Actinoplanes brasiliensis]GID29374.1 short-chain dehydrogenase [Actinoplanes brasiliensis]
MKGSIVVVLGGTAGIGLETARLARASAADVIVTGRDQGRLDAARDELGATTARLDLGDTAAVTRFLAGLPAPVDHVLLSGGGPFYAPLAEMDLDRVRQFLDEHIVGKLRLARECASLVRPGGSLTFISGTGARRPAVGISVAAIGTAAITALTTNLAVEIAPVRVNAVAAGFVDTPLSARILGDDLEARRSQLRDTLPIRRVVGPADVAATILHLMTNTAVTGAIYDVDGGQQLIR